MGNGHWLTMASQGSNQSVIVSTISSLTQLVLAQLSQPFFRGCTVLMCVNVCTQITGHTMSLNPPLGNL